MPENNEEIKIGVAGLTSPLTQTTLETFIESMPDPDLILNKKGMARSELKKLLTDTEISSAMNRRKNAILTMPYRFEGEDEKHIEFANWLAGEYVHKVLNAAHKSVPYGFNVIEMNWREEKYTTDFGEFWLPTLMDMPVDPFTFTKDGKCVFTPAEGEPFAITDVPSSKFKFIITQRDPSYENPYGESILSRLFWSWFFRHNALRSWSIGTEKATIPMLLIESSEKDQTKLDELATKIYQSVLDGVMILPKGAEAKPINREGDLKALEMFMNYHDKQIRRVVLGQSGTSDIGDKGSYAAISKLQEVTMDERDADARIVGPSMQAFINAVFGTNYGSGVKVPKFIMEDKREIQPERAKQDQILAGIIHKQGGRFSKSYLTEKYNYKDDHIIMDDDAPLVEGNTNLTDEEKKQSANRNKLFGFARKQTDDQMKVDSFIDDALKMAKSPVDPKLISAIIENSKDIDDLAKKLSRLLSGESEEFETLLADSKVSMDAFGFQQAEEELNES